MRGRPSTRRPLLACAVVTAGAVLVSCGSGDGGASRPATSAAASSPSSSATSSATPATSSTAATTRPSTPTPSRTTERRSSRPAPTPPTPTTSRRTRSAPSTARLPLDLDTGDARQLVTVTARSHGSTTATLQRWTRVGSRWARVGSSVDAYLGSDGIGRASEGSNRTPAGSFTLTQAFGANSDPGTRLPYFRSISSDYWISSAGAKYNTHQRCGSCGYDNGVNERLARITPEYNYAAVIDYNTANAPGGVRAGAGSAFFLHVSAGEPTAGCVSIPQDRLVTVLRWLDPDRHPRILLGVG